MYISKLFVQNYRSLQQAVVRFEPGKNVIVGKNNSGKSNIIRAIEILIGEKFPTYLKFTDNDYFTYEYVDEDTGEIIEKIAENLFMEVTLEGRDFDEETIGSIKKKTAFSKVRSLDDLYTKDEETGEIQINYDLFQNLDDLDNREEIVPPNSSARYKAKWMPHGELLSFLQNSSHIKLFFCKSRTEEELSGFGIIVIDNNGSIWISHFLSKKLRDSLITTTVISALRSPKEDLRLVHYTWFGKLIENLWNQNKDAIDGETEESYEKRIANKSVEIKNLVDLVFSENTLEIRNLLKRAIAHKAVSFKFLNDGKSDLYKNVRIFVNDGIDRPLSEKGTGIQSAIIIALFSQYCNNFHNRSSLLIAEEPELFLHPQSRRVISAELNGFLNQSEAQERQLIITTHSVDYLKNVDPKNIIRVYKDAEGNESLVNQLSPDTANEISNEIKRTIWSANAEIFFADKVILVEGGELYLMPSIVDVILDSDQSFDYANYSIARVNGKGNFLTYVKILDELDIEWFVLGDLDCYKDEIRKLATHLSLSTVLEKLEVISSKISENETNYQKVLERINGLSKNYDAQKLKSLFEKFRNKIITSEEPELIEIIEYMAERYKTSDLPDLMQSEEVNKTFNEIQKILKENNVFIWSKGELENYYSQVSIKLSGTKDLKALELSYLIKEEGAISTHLIHEEEIKELVQLITKGHYPNKCVI